MRHNAVNVSTLFSPCTKLEEEKSVDVKFMSNADQNKENSSTFYKTYGGVKVWLHSFSVLDGGQRSASRSTE